MGYQGHQNWTHWSVCLWLHNDEALYRLVKRAVRKTDNLDEAADLILDDLHEAGLTQTSDGAVYSKTAIRAALRGWR